MAPSQTLCPTAFSLLRAASLLPLPGPFRSLSCHSSWPFGRGQGTLQPSANLFHLQQEAGDPRDGPVQQLLLRVPMEQVVQGFGELDELRLGKDTEGTVQRRAAQLFHWLLNSQSSAWCSCSNFRLALRNLCVSPSPSLDTLQPQSND